MHRLPVVVAVTCVITLGAVGPAHAEGPTPRGPEGGGCGASFDPLTVEEAAAISPAAGAVAAKDDVNQDQLICLKFLPRRPGGGGVIVDNDAVGRG